MTSEHIESVSVSMSQNVASDKPNREDTPPASATISRKQTLRLLRLVKTRRLILKQLLPASQMQLRDSKTAASRMRMKSVIGRLAAVVVVAAAVPLFL